MLSADKKIYDIVSCVHKEFIEGYLKIIRETRKYEGLFCNGE